MVLSVRQRRWLRKNPAPPPTPEGMVYATRWGRTELVPAKRLQRACKAEYRQFDELPEAVRLRVKETGQMPNDEEIRRIHDAVKQNTRTRSLGFGRAV